MTNLDGKGIYFRGVGGLCFMLTIVMLVWIPLLHSFSKPISFTDYVGTFLIIMVSGIGAIYMAAAAMFVLDDILRKTFGGQRVIR